MLKYIKKNKSGLSLLEMIVAMGIFSVTILMATQIFHAVLVGQRNAIAAQNLQENMRFAFETMAKEIRTAQASDGECATLFSPAPTPEKKIFNSTFNSEGDILYFKNAEDSCVVYRLLDGAMMVNRGGQTAQMTSNRITISDLNFEIIDDDIISSHTVQPRVTMRMTIEAKGDEMNKQAMEMQTTVSSRYYE